MSTSSFRWGLIGPGKIAHTFAKAVEVIDDSQVYAVASRSGDRAKAFAQKYGASKIFASYEAMIEDNDVDGVYIATPHPFHHDQAMLCLEAGKPVLCEKPLTVNAADTRHLIETANANSVFLMEALWTRYLPIYDQIRKWLDGNQIGDIKLLSSNFCFRAPDDPEHRTWNHELAGGALLDIGVYNIAVSQWVFGANPVSFDACSILSETNVDALTAATLSYSGDRVSQFTCSFLVDGANDFTIFGTEGRIRIHPNFWGATEATLIKGAQQETKQKPFQATGFEYEIEEATRCIRAGLLESPGMTHADTLANLELMDAIRTEAGLKYSFE
jgi:dihydrodiol dehydrogenase / D-xylose 1-dehydrogenase (NADP)